MDDDSEDNPDVITVTTQDPPLEDRRLVRSSGRSWGRYAILLGVDFGTGAGAGLAANFLGATATQGIINQFGFNPETAPRVVGTLFGTAITVNSVRRNYNLGKNLPKYFKAKDSTCYGIGTTFAYLTGIGVMYMTLSAIAGNPKGASYLTAGLIGAVVKYATLASLYKGARGKFGPYIADARKKEIKLVRPQDVPYYLVQYMVFAYFIMVVPPSIIHGYQRIARGEHVKTVNIFGHQVPISIGIVAEPVAVSSLYKPEDLNHLLFLSSLAIAFALGEGICRGLNDKVGKDLVQVFSLKRRKIDFSIEFVTKFWGEYFKPKALPPPAVAPDKASIGEAFKNAGNAAWEEASSRLNGWVMLGGLTALYLFSQSKISIEEGIILTTFQSLTSKERGDFEAVAKEIASKWGGIEIRGKTIAAQSASWMLTAYFTTLIGNAVLEKTRDTLPGNLKIVLPALSGVILLHQLFLRPAFEGLFKARIEPINVDAALPELDPDEDWPVIRQRKQERRKLTNLQEIFKPSSVASNVFLGLAVGVSLVYASKLPPIVFPMPSLALGDSRLNWVELPSLIQASQTGNTSLAQYFANPLLVTAVTGLVGALNTAYKLSTTVRADVDRVAYTNPNDGMLDSLSQTWRALYKKGPVDLIENLFHEVASVGTSVTAGIVVNGLAKLSINHMQEAHHISPEAATFLTALQTAAAFATILEVLEKLRKRREEETIDQIPFRTTAKTIGGIGRNLANTIGVPTPDSWGPGNDESLANAIFGPKNSDTGTWAGVLRYGAKGTVNRVNAAIGAAKGLTVVAPQVLFDGAKLFSRLWSTTPAPETRRTEDEVFPDFNTSDDGSLDEQGNRRGGDILMRPTIPNIPEPLPTIIQTGVGLVVDTDRRGDPSTVIVPDDDDDRRSPLDEGVIGHSDDLEKDDSISINSEARGNQVTVSDLGDEEDVGDKYLVDIDPNESLKEVTRQLDEIRDRFPQLLKLQDPVLGVLQNMLERQKIILGLTLSSTDESSSDTQVFLRAYEKLYEEKIELIWRSLDDREEKFDRHTGISQKKSPLQLFLLTELARDLDNVIVALQHVKSEQSPDLIVKNTDELCGSIESLLEKSADTDKLDWVKEFGRAQSKYYNDISSGMMEEYAGEDQIAQVSGLAKKTRELLLKLQKEVSKLDMDFSQLETLLTLDDDILDKQKDFHSDSASSEEQGLWEAESDLAYHLSKDTFAPFQGISGSTVERKMRGLLTARLKELVAITENTPEVTQPIINELQKYGMTQDQAEATRTLAQLDLLAISEWDARVDAASEERKLNEAEINHFAAEERKLFDALKKQASLSEKAKEHIKDLYDSFQICSPSEDDPVPISQLPQDAEELEEIAKYVDRQEALDKTSASASNPGPRIVFNSQMRGLYPTKEGTEIERISALGGNKERVGMFEEATLGSHEGDDATKANEAWGIDPKNLEPWESKAREVPLSRPQTPAISSFKEGASNDGGDSSFTYHTPQPKLRSRRSSLRSSAGSRPTTPFTSSFTSSLTEPLTEPLTESSDARSARMKHRIVVPTFSPGEGEDSGATSLPSAPSLTLPSRQPVQQEVSTLKYTELPSPVIETAAPKSNILPYILDDDSEQPALDLHSQIPVSKEDSRKPSISLQDVIVPPDLAIKVIPATKSGTEDKGEELTSDTMKNKKPDWNPDNKYTIQAMKDRENKPFTATIKRIDEESAYLKVHGKFRDGKSVVVKVEKAAIAGSYNEGDKISVTWARKHPENSDSTDVKFVIGATNKKQVAKNKVVGAVKNAGEKTMKNTLGKIKSGR